MALSDHLAAARALIAEQYPLGAAHEPQQPLLAALTVAGALEGLTGALEGRSGELVPPTVGEVFPWPSASAVEAAKPPEGEWILGADRMPTEDEQQGGLVWKRYGLSHQLCPVSGLGPISQWKPFVSASDWITHRTPTPTDGPVVLIPHGDGTTYTSLDSHLVVPGQPWAPLGTNPGPYPF
jgi:hypothetical protein